MIKFKIKTSSVTIAIALAIITLGLNIFVYMPLIMWVLSKALNVIGLIPTTAGYAECFWSGLFLILIKEFFKEGK
jgi:hypothetical protein